jgi:alpha-tubulin suppressor-like RCC1 family protein
VRYGTDPDLLADDTSIRTANGSFGQFQLTVTGLQPATTYYFAAFASTEGGTFHGATLSFQTAVMAPTITTTVGKIWSTSVVAGGMISADGGAPVTARGVVLGLALLPTIHTGNRVDAGAGIGAFNVWFSNLLPGRVYYVRAYAITQTTVTYGNTIAITTPYPQLRGRVVAVAAGYNHSLFVMRDGSLWAMGNNAYGQLGDGTISSRSLPVKVADGVVSAAAGLNMSFFIRRDGSLWAMGDNNNGRLGDGTNRARRTPVQVEDQVRAVAAFNHAVILTKDGRAWLTGQGGYQRLVEIGSGIKAVAMAERPLFIDFFGSLWSTMNAHVFAPQLIDREVAHAAGGNGHVLYIKEDGSLWGVGNNGVGQLGDGTTYSRYAPVRITGDVRAVCGGGGHSLFIMTDGSLWATGGNYSGQLGNGTLVDRHLPVQIAAGVIAAAAGNEHSLFVKQDGSLWVVGSNADGQLGIGTAITNHSTAIPIVVPLAFDPASLYSSCKWTDWFGWYDDAAWPWIWDYQAEQWLRVVDEGPEDVWLWSHATQAWYWTRTDIFPATFSLADSAWHID